MSIQNTNLTYERFKHLAKSKKLEDFEKVGFNKEMRKGMEQDILENILVHVPALRQEKRPLTVLDIGCGCSKLTELIIRHCKQNQFYLALNDSQEMLNELKDKDDFVGIPGKFPQEVDKFIAESKERFDVILCNSVIQYVVIEGYVEEFLQGMDYVLAHGGVCYIGDIPNADKRNKFYESDIGRRKHQEYLEHNGLPLDTPVGEAIDNISELDVLFILNYFESKGYEVHRYEQSRKLASYGKREDILIKKP